MKKFFPVLILLLLATSINAQVRTIPKKLVSLKREMVSRTTAQPRYGSVDVKVELTQTEGKGETLKFSSNTAIDRVEISFVGVPNSKQTTSYNANSMDGYFYLESGAYKGGQQKGYLFHFYVKGFDKPVWVCALTEKK